MIAVIFEVIPEIEHKSRYLDLAAELRPLLDGIDGFISIERFKSLNDENKILSLSFWESEDAILEWRKLEVHREAQSEGREGVFSSYRLRVANVNRDYGLNEREQAPVDSNHHFLVDK